MGVGVVFGESAIRRDLLRLSGATQEGKDAAILPVIPESVLRATLGILARAVAPGKPRPGASAG